MQPFEFSRVDSASAAVQAQGTERGNGPDAINAASQYLAGGTTLLDLMKLNVMRPSRIIDINGVSDAGFSKISAGPDGLTLGAMARMADAAENTDVKTNYPMIAQSLALAASAQIRNMASLGGNVLQRTRCTYFRDTSYANCNKRTPGSGCAALEGFNRTHAVLGASDNCIATYAGDLAHALIALDAQIDITGPRGSRRMAFADLHRVPGNTPNVETTLAPGELITAFHVPAGPWTRRSMYLKVRDRESYEFALASAAVALDLEGGQVKQARIALGGVSTKPWRSRDAEDKLNGKPFNETAAEAAADAAFSQAKSREHNGFKVELGKRTLVRALQQVATMEIPT
jgi:xanthine dehydrogenase YagS FAD-binding subunit